MNSAATHQRQQYRQFLYDTFPTTHVGVLNIKPLKRAGYSGLDWTANIYSDFLRKFNHNIYGRHRGTKQVGAVALAHNRRHIDDTHIHIGFWGLPLRLSDSQLNEKFMNAAQHTTGVLYQRYAIKPSAALVSVKQQPEADTVTLVQAATGARTVFFERQRTAHSWMNYSSRLVGWNGDNWDDCLFNLTALPISNGPVHQWENQISL